MTGGTSSSHFRRPPSAAASSVPYSATNNNSENVCGRMISSCHRPKKANTASAPESSSDFDFLQHNHTRPPMTRASTSELTVCTRARPPCPNSQ